MTALATKEVSLCQLYTATQQCEWIALLTVCDSFVPLKVDSGAQVNILSLSDYEGLASKPKY